ncbi:TonB C-terminal domain-containing protein [Sulfurimonas sp.]
MDNQKYFYISGFISLSLFGFFLILFVVMLFQVKDMKTYGMKKKNYISISINVAPVKKVSKKATSVQSKIESSVKSKSKNINVNSLFDDVWTQKIQHKKIQKKKNSKRINEIQKQLKLKENNHVESIEKSMDKFAENKKDDQNSTSSTANEVNEYLAKIQAIVYKHFNVPQNSEGNSVKTVIELGAFGKVLDFRVLTYSSNEALNNEVDKIKDRLKNVVFPINPDGKITKTIVILVSKE